MLKIIGSFLAGIVLTVGLGWNSLGSLMFSEQVSPFTVEETTARIQQNIQAAGNGWSISGLRNPAKPIEAEGGNVLPVLLIEACSPIYSGPILKEDRVRFLSLLMPCKISVYKKSDGKVYIGILNAGMIGRLFGPMVGDVMAKVVVDQKKFLVMDPSKPAPALIVPKPAGQGGSGAAAAEGC
ncbi:MAG: DUF302 domain-containing protein [Rhodocyclaceae bacterium]